MDNLAYYNLFREVPKEAQKSFNNGSFSGTDINPMWRIKKLTEVFGAAGFGWYTQVCEHWEEQIEGEVLTNVSINLFVKDPKSGEWSAPIYGIGGNKALQQFRDKKKVSDEAYKMAYTDALSVACKALGIGADIYFSNDRTKYTAATAEQAPARYTPLPEGQYWKVVENYANGVITKTGGDYRTAWMKMTNAGKEQLAKFDHDVENFIVAHKGFTEI